MKAQNERMNERKQKKNSATIYKLFDESEKNFKSIIKKSTYFFTMAQGKNFHYTKISYMITFFLNVDMNFLHKPSALSLKYCHRADSDSKRYNHIVVDVAITITATTAIATFKLISRSSSSSSSPLSPAEPPILL